MADNKPADDVDVTQAWRALAGQARGRHAAPPLRRARLGVAIGSEIAGVVLLLQAQVRPRKPRRC